jgi:ABC-type uncharacterized transport system permease subunit
MSASATLSLKLRHVTFTLALPLLNLLAALFISALIILLIGEDPIQTLEILVRGAFGSTEVLGYTLYYATNFVFTGLAVAFAFKAGLFNIGGDGQAYLGGLGVALACLYFDHLPWPLLWALSMAMAMLFGAMWAWVPGWLQARRGSHVVVTTIMFNYIASALMNYLLVQVLIAPGQPAPETREFHSNTWLPSLHGLLNSAFGWSLPVTPLNVSVFVALFCCVLFYVVVWRTRWGYTIRTVGSNERAARYAGMPTRKVIVLAMCVSGSLAGLVALNDVQGVHHRLTVNFTEGVGFVGIAVALMGRNHPFGIVLAALLFGALTQGGTELSMEVPRLTREMVVMIEGLIILFCGALENMFRPSLGRLLGVSN